MSIEMSSEQINFLFQLLDAELKRSGLSSLTKVVDIYNVLLSVKTNEVKSNEGAKKSVERTQKRVQHGK